MPVTALLALGALSGALGAATAASGYSGILYLLLCFTCAAFYLLCAGAGFLGYAYLLVYVGAIAILFLFANMLSVRSSGRTPSSWGPTIATQASLLLTIGAAVGTVPGGAAQGFISLPAQPFTYLPPFTSGTAYLLEALPAILAATLVLLFAICGAVALARDI